MGGICYQPTKAIVIKSLLRMKGALALGVIKYNQPHTGATCDCIKFFQKELKKPCRFDCFLFYTRIFANQK